MIVSSMHSYMTQKVTEAEILNKIRKIEDPVFTTTEIAEEFDITRQAALYRLDNLTDRGVLKKKSVGRSVVFYVNEDKWLLQLDADA